MPEITTSDSVTGFDDPAVGVVNAAVASAVLTDTTSDPTKPANAAVPVNDAALVPS